MGRITIVAVLLVTACSDEPIPGPADVGDASGADAPLDADGLAGPDEAAAPDGDADPGDVGPDVPPDVPVVPYTSVEVEVLLDGAPVADAVVMQGGALGMWLTDTDGRVTIPIDREIEGNPVVLASFPTARITPFEIYGEVAPSPVRVELTSYDASDNPQYEFQDPGEPGRRDTTAQCGHCHLTINDAWFESAHRSAAKNPRVHDIYAGAAAAWDNQAACEVAGGRWLAGLEPGTGAPAERCYIGEGALPDLNEGCGEPGQPSCDAQATDFGGCADCHAPVLAGGKGGALGGRDLLAATGLDYEFGVHCDVCHKVDEVDLDAEDPGTGGTLRLMRPSEPGSVALGLWKPLTFGPTHDVPNVRMGSVQRDHFANGQLCAGCHQLDVAPMAPGLTLDSARWPEGKLPIQSTWREWSEGPLSPEAPCTSCHMPPDPMVLNQADLQAFPEASVGVVGGWPRPTGQVARHSFVGPRTPGSRMLQLAAGLHLDAQVEGEALTVEVTTRNVGPGHALPTGEPMRTMALLVDARCGDAPLPATGGDAVPDFGGALAAKPAGEDWSLWPGAEPGQVIRVVARPGGYHDYAGVGPFGAATTFSPEDKGMPVEHVVGARIIQSVDATGAVTLDAPLPEGDLAYLGEAAPAEGDPMRAIAGASGFAFGRILVGQGGERQVAHFRAVDVASDNRLPPGGAWTSSHSFAASCEQPTVRARLFYRAYPLGLARERGWSNPEILMVAAELTLEAPPQPASAEVAEPTGETLALTLTATQTETGYAYDGGAGPQSPGPVLRATLGDTLEVELVNALPDPTTIHWHGVEVPWEMDGVTWQQAPIAPGERFTYSFPLNHAGTFWYHPHFDTARQVDLGLYGVLIVEDPAEPKADEELVLVFDTASEFTETLEAHATNDRARRWLVNGQAQPELGLAGGSVVRARLLNASSHGYLSIPWPEAANARQIGGDQGLLAAPRTPELLVLGPGDRAEVELRIGEAGFAVETTIHSVHGGAAYGDPLPLFSVAVEGPAPAPEPLDWPFSGAAPTADPGHTDIYYTLQGSDAGGGWLINGERFPDVTIEAIPLGATRIIEVRNLSPAEHPFHTHGHHFEVLSIDGQPPTHRTLDDTLNIGIRQSARLRLVATNPGEWMTHCHILPHADFGMMTVLKVGDSPP